MSIRSRAILAALCCTVTLSEAHAGSDPSYEWRTLSTANFRVHYHQGGERLARRIAAIAEEAYTRCQKEFGLVPSQVVEIVLRDSLDVPNAFAQTYPYDRIEVLAHPPGPDSELAYYDDPYRVLVFHEYAHVIHMDQFSGVPRLINNVLGKTLVPNAAVPAWFSEGFATFVESHFTRAGRVGSPLFAMYLRSAALADDLLGLSELTEAPARMPRGTAPYLYGSAFFDFLARRYGVERMIEFIRDYGRRVIPFALNHLARRHFRADFMALYEDFIREVRDEAARVASRIREAGPIEGRLITNDGEIKGPMVFASDSRTLYLVQSDGRSASGVFALDLISGSRRRVVTCYGGCAGLERDETTLLVTHLEPYRTYSAYADVFRLDPTTGAEKRLTRRARARDPTPLPDGWIAYVSSDFDEVSVVAFKPETGETRTVVSGGRFLGIGGLRAIPGTNRLVFSANDGVQWDLWAVDTLSQDIWRLTHDSALERSPALSPDGRWVVFSSDRDGVFNLYAIEVSSRQLRRLTRVLGGAFWPAVSPDSSTLAFASWSARGFDIAVLNFDPDGPGAVVSSEESESPIRDPYNPEPLLVTDSEYSPWPSLRPRSLRPRYFLSSQGLSILGAEVSGQDAVGHHRFKAKFESEMTAWRPSASVSYAYERLFPTLALDLATAPSSVFTFVDNRLLETLSRDWVVGLSLFEPIPWRDRSFSAGLGYSISWTTGVSRANTRDPASSQPLAFGGIRSAALTLFAAHDSTESYVWSISPERGFAAGLSLALRRRELGGQGNSVTISGHWYQYLPMPWAHGHVLALLSSFGWSRGDRGYEVLYGLGGFPRQDVIAAIVNRQPWNTRGLRGFRPGALIGNTYALVNAEYRLPIVALHRGLDTLPAVARRLWATVFADSGGAWNGLPARRDFRWNIGAEVALTCNLALTLPLTFRLGYAHGFGPGGQDVIYFIATP